MSSKCHLVDGFDENQPVPCIEKKAPLLTCGGYGGVNYQRFHFHISWKHSVKNIDWIACNEEIKSTNKPRTNDLMTIWLHCLWFEHKQNALTLNLCTSNEMCTSVGRMTWPEEACASKSFFDGYFWHFKIEICVCNFHAKWLRNQLNLNRMHFELKSQSTSRAFSIWFGLKNQFLRRNRRKVLHFKAHSSSISEWYDETLFCCKCKCFTSKDTKCTCQSYRTRFSRFLNARIEKTQCHCRRILKRLGSEIKWEHN